MSESAYKRAWRERGEAEAALRQWRKNQGSPAFYKFTGFLGILAGAVFMIGAIEEASWHSIPIAILGLLFLHLPFTVPAIIRDEAKARDEALATLRRLGIKTPSF